MPADVGAGPEAQVLEWVAPEWLHPVLRRLRVLGDVPLAELGVIGAAIRGRTRHAVGEAPLGEREGALFVVKGWAASHRLLADGRRQILRLILPGDLIGGSAGAGARGLPIVALTPLETASAASVVEAALQRPDGALRRALGRAAWRDEQLLIDQVTRIGRLAGAERLADLLIELRDRLALTGLGDARRFPLPLTQDVLADVLGLSIVHVSRLKSELKAAGLLEWRAGMVTLPDTERLAALACREPQTAWPQVRPPAR